MGRGFRKKLFTLSTDPESALSAAYTPDGKEIITSSLDSALRIWSALDGKPIGRIVQSGPYPGALKVSPGGRSFVVVNGDV
jgi:hypothetical protein